MENTDARVLLQHIYNTYGYQISKNFKDNAIRDAFELADKALEKQIAKKPTYEGDGYDYCPSCGQKLDLDRDEQPVAFSMGAKLIDNFVNPFEIKAGGNS